MTDQPREPHGTPWGGEPTGAQPPTTGATPPGHGTQPGYGTPPAPGVEHTQEIPPQRPTQEIPPAAAPAWAQQPAAPAASGATPSGPAPRRRGWIVPAALATGVLLGGGGIAVGAGIAHDGGTSTAAAATASATSEIGTKTAPPVEQSSAVAPDWVKTAAAVNPSVVSIDVTSSSAEGEGSGVIIDSAGHIVTNNHVASGAGPTAKITVTLSDQRAYTARVVGTDPSTDLAVIQLDGAPKDLVPVAFGDDRELKVGQPVMAVGNPLGLSGTVTTGIVSALNRPVTTSERESQQQDPFGGSQGGATAVFTNAIQTSAAINPGNSGGALVDAGGRLVGINSSIASLGSSGSSQSGNIGIGFAIPVSEVTTISKQLIATGKAEHAYLGVKAPTGIVKDGDGQREAAVVAQVYPNTPAATAGLKNGDAIIALDGSPITGYESLISRVFGKSVGDVSTVDYIRDGKRAQAKITFTKRPAQ